MGCEVPDGAVRSAHEVRPRAFTLELTKGCNLRCGYCYYAARDDAYDPRETMSPEVAEQAVERLLADGPADRPVHLHLFGGEPLLNVPLLRHVVEYGERRAAEVGRAITFELTTNGTRFSGSVIELLNRHRIAVGVSFDGPPHVQDRARPALAGSSYERAVPGIRAFLASREGTGLMAKTHCSVVVTRLELDLVKIVEHLEQLGFRRIILTPATDLGGHAFGLRERDLPSVLAAYDALAERFEQRLRRGEPASVTWFDLLLGRVKSGRRVQHFCRGGLDYLGVAADGRVSLCYRFYEDHDYGMGHVATGIERRVTEQLLARPLDSRPACSRCWARYFCGGGCHHENLISTGALADPNPVTCEILRHGMARTLEIWARLLQDGVLPRASGSPAMTADPAAFSTDDRPATKPSCYVREVGGERVVYEPEGHEVVLLNATAAAIFALCDGSRTVGELLAALVRRYDAPEDLLRRDLLATLADFDARGLLRAR